LEGTLNTHSEIRSADWRPFAESLTRLADNEGKEQFLDLLFEFLNSFVHVDSCSVFKISADKTTGARHLCTFGSLEEGLANLLAKDYVINGFKNDPMVQTAIRSPRVKVRHLPSSHYSPNYRSQYFKKADLIDKVTSIHSSQSVLFVVNFYRIERSGEFSQIEFKDLETLAPIISKFVLSHTQLKERHSQNDYADKVFQLINDETQIFTVLSPKERDVCRAILLGQDEKGIAAAMGISLNTVITHRRRLYSKLNITSQSELFKLALMANH